MLKTTIILIAVFIVTKADHTAYTSLYENEAKPDGSYKYRYETSNGITAIENGLGGHAAGGFVQWISPEGIPVSFTYTADQFGYRPVGSAIPTPPPIPDYILRSLEQNRIEEDLQSRLKPEEDLSKLVDIRENAPETS